MTSSKEWEDWLFFGGETPKLVDNLPEVPLPDMKKPKNIEVKFIVSEQPIEVSTICNFCSFDKCLCKKTFQELINESF